jgi:hypothetical protein
MNYVQPVVDRLAALLPDCPSVELLNTYALLALAKGSETTPRDVHDAWSIWMNDIRPDHYSLVPYVDLIAEKQRFDEIPCAAIHAVVAEMGL